MVNKELLTVKETAEVLGVTRNTIYLWIRKGLPFIEVGPSNKKRFDIKEVEQWYLKQGD